MITLTLFNPSAAPNPAVAEAQDGSSPLERIDTTPFKGRTISAKNADLTFSMKATAVASRILNVLTNVKKDQVIDGILKGGIAGAAFGATLSAFMGFADFGGSLGLGIVVGILGKGLQDISKSYAHAEKLELLEKATSTLADRVDFKKTTVYHTHKKATINLSNVNDTRLTPDAVATILLNDESSDSKKDTNLLDLSKNQKVDADFIKDLFSSLDEKTNSTGNYGALVGKTVSLKNSGVSYNSLAKALFPNESTRPQPQSDARQIKFNEITFDFGKETGTTSEEPTTANARVAGVEV